MTTNTFNNIKLGLFTIAGLLFLVLLLYMIGKNRSLFGSTYELKAHFQNTNGLKPGNNVRYAGIEVGTVKRISIQNDTTIEVLMVLQKKMQKIIRTNAIVDIASDGLLGNKVVNITPSHFTAAFATEGTILPARKSIDTEEMLRTLDITNRNISVISDELKRTVQRLNSSSAFWRLLNNEKIPEQINATVSHLNQASIQANNMMNNANSLVNYVNQGNGSLGHLIKDTLFVRNLNEAVLKIKNIGTQADSLAQSLQRISSQLNTDINHGNGIAHAILKDTNLTNQLQNSVLNIQQGTESFNRNMEA
ncbi:MAG: MlaD family protein, partial [Lacibacter sp.]